jgi:anaphase-promoting complex subunit 1
MTVEVLLDEIGRRPGGSGDAGGIRSVAWAQEREGYALAAGLALGLVTLGSGRSALGLADLRIEDRLRSASLPYERINFLRKM